LYALVVRLGLPESPRWLAARGRTAEAERVVAEFEGAARFGGSTTAPTAARAAAAVPPARNRLAAIWAPEYRLRTAAIWAVWFCVNFAYYGAFILIPIILVDAGFGLVRSFGFTLLIPFA